ncbi:hypothetical protein Pmani_021562 [Petrolisthes manimaculis]|uniref:Uncharacterized protein n=1 Tax=Petrolisthes manimaculis TaxID=1843537 RepID=A0AAE1U568_9EUCA|nr:hypothetical protein Pmani_021562 [Petrolisthes manimaculis]
MGDDERRDEWIIARMTGRWNGDEQIGRVRLAVLAWINGIVGDWLTDRWVGQPGVRTNTAPTFLSTPDATLKKMGLVG